MLDDLRLLRMPGSSILAPDAALWTSDLLAAAYYARPDGARDVDDLRLAHGILATRWASTGRRVGVRDLPAVHRAFGGLRLARRGGRFGTLDGAALRQGGARLLGPWFPAAWDDPERRAYGIAFATARDRETFVPEDRLEHAALQRLTPPRRDPAEQDWHAYPATELPDVPAALALLTAPWRWPDFASELGRFTPLRSGGIEGQTFEIEVALDAVPRIPAWTRGYVTARRVLLAGHDPGPEAYVGALDPAWLGAPAVPVGARVLAVLELVTHAGHFLGRAISRLLVYEADGRGWVRDIGSWDPLGPLAGAGYRLSGRRAQHLFWGTDRPAASMLAQLARVAGRGV